MTGKIPEEVIHQIRESNDITDVISDYVQLKKQGRNYFGLCPFHGESTPSFSVSPEKQIYHCFGCGAGGNVYSFLMDIENISFTEATSRLAKRAGIPLQFHTDETPKTSIPNDFEKMLSAHELLTKFYHHLLINTKEGQEALEYLFTRGFTKELIEKFEIGWSLPHWDFATRFLQKRGFSAQLMEKAGLSIRSEKDEGYFDRFRGRIMFPLHDSKGKVVAFSARSLNNEQPKYLNSPETPLFNKSELLYNFHRARPLVRKDQQFILLEGFADVITADQAGVHNAIATMGTSLTDRHVQAIKRVTDQVIICYDGDSAGIQASFRAATLLSEQGLKLRIAALPDKLDPDDYIKLNGAEKFKNEIIGASLTFMAFKMLYYRQNKNLQDEGDKLQYIEEILVEISKLRNAVERDHYLRLLADEFSLSLEALKFEQKQIYFAEKKRQPLQFQTPQKIVYPRTESKLYPAFHTAERRLIAHMLKDGDIAYKVRELLNGETFNLDEHQAIFTYLLGYYEKGNEANSSDFINEIPDVNLRQVVTNIEMMVINDEISDQELSDYIKEVLKHQKVLKIKEKMKEEKEAERQKDYAKAAKIAMEILQIRKTF
ncbi:DNA primase [Oikeobacillus pervagus]|uniref:DNA primase n=1 Tax=Oikeobacillus pervagus TaxID=1325931 RepID=A0AAJ1T273_9BACI|nr:DNA primase [Oikeobacillus pervagus]MDQ0213906.1 DNA primase [Oikeobacillus pervagus]